MAKLADEAQVRSRSVGHLEKVCDTMVIPLKALGKLQKNRAELCAQGADSLGKVLPRLFDVQQPSCVREPTIGLYREDKVLRDKLRPVLIRLESNRVIEGRVNLGGQKLLGIELQVLPTWKLWGIENPPPIHIAPAGESDPDLCAVWPLLSPSRAVRALFLHRKGTWAKITNQGVPSKTSYSQFFSRYMTREESFIRETQEQTRR